LAAMALHRCKPARPQRAGTFTKPSCHARNPWNVCADRKCGHRNFASGRSAGFAFGAPPPRAGHLALLAQPDRGRPSKWSRFNRVPTTMRPPFEQPEAKDDTLSSRSSAALSASTASHRVCPGFLPLFGKLHPKLHRVPRGTCESVCVRPSARRASAGQRF
jgi:hypothetical protein